MSTTTYAWTREFPIVFIPTFIQYQVNWKWVILHYITGYIGTRESPVYIINWHAYTMRRSDSITASHPKFSLVIYNHKIKTSLQCKGHFIINTYEMDPPTTIATFCDAICDDDITIKTKKILKTAHIHAINIPGTATYRKSTCHEFKAINLYDSYMKKQEISIFCMVSLAEYHEYSLRNLLSLYTEQLTGLPRNYSYLIRLDDANFTDALQKY